MFLIHVFPVHIPIHMCIEADIVMLKAAPQTCSQMSEAVQHNWYSFDVPIMQLLLLV